MGWRHAIRAAMLLALACDAAPCAAAAQDAFPAPAATDSASLSTALPALAKVLIASYTERDSQRYLDNLARLQLVARKYAEAGKTLSRLRNLRSTSEPDAGIAYVPYEIFAEAKSAQVDEGQSFEEAFKRAFRHIVDPMDNRTSALVMRSFGVSVAVLQADLQNALDGLKGKAEISQVQALALIHAYQVEEMLRVARPLTTPLIAEDDRRRYVVATDLPIRAQDVATVCAFVVRPRWGAPRLPTLLEFTIYADRTAYLSEARRDASNGYVGVVGFTRGKACSPDEPVPYEHDGSDAAMLIDWIAKQAWSDGRVGMYGGSYNSFVQWAAAKRIPHALKALMPAVSNAPGIDTPMEGNVFQSFSYPWPLYVSAAKWLDASTEGDPSRWIRLENTWYVSGKAYRAMDELDGTPNPIWDQWLSHPSYDAYWQRLIPYGQEFAGITIPVLTTDGYLAGQNVGGLYYFIQYHKYNPKAENYLVIGPYDHIRGQRGTVTSLGGDVDVVAGYRIDPAAHIDLGLLRYQWFDYIFKRAPRPALLRDAVNYEVMGGNEWKHAPSIDAMHNRMLRFYLSARRAGGLYTLASVRPVGEESVLQSVDLADRSDVARVPPATGLDTYLGVAFESSPFEQAFDLSGRFAGHLDFVTNKKDLDVNVSLYQVTPDGKYVGVTYTMARASYVRDRSHRQLLEPGKPQRIDFESNRLTSWAFPAGSRLVVLLSIVKEPDIQINYGTGKNVSDESLADAKVPLQVEWFSDSFVDVPTWR